MIWRDSIELENYLITAIFSAISSAIKRKSHIIAQHSSTEIANKLKTEKSKDNCDVDHGCRNFYQV